MRVKATSQFHGQDISAAFNLSVGVNIRKINTKKINPCSGEHGTCGCGWPFTRTAWELPEGYVLLNPPIEVGPSGEYYGRGYIQIEILHV